MPLTEFYGIDLVLSTSPLDSRLTKENRCECLETKHPNCKSLDQKYGPQST